MKFVYPSQELKEAKLAYLRAEKADAERILAEMIKYRYGGDVKELGLKRAIFLPYYIHVANWINKLIQHRIDEASK